MTESLLVRDLMTVGVKTCAPDTPIADIAQLLLDENIEGLAVLDEQGHAVGTVSHDELIQVFAQENWQSLTAQDVMRPGMPQIPPNIPIAAAAQLMQDMGVRIVFLTHHAGGIEYPAGVLTYRHLLRYIAAKDDDDLSDLGIKSSRQSPIEIFMQKRDAARRRNRPREE